MLTIGDIVAEKSARILHVEDNRSLQNLVKIGLERLGGYVVCTAADGFAAVDLAREFAPDLILLDLDLPGRDGVETLRALRDLEGLRDTPAMFLTAMTDAQVKARLMALGACEVLAKPFRPRELLEAIGKILVAQPGQA